MEKIIESIKKHEGFESKPYPDPLHGWKVPTFGHGLTYITEAESIWIVKRRLLKIKISLDNSLPFYEELPAEAKHVLIEMSYQLGVSGLLKFKKMLKFLEEKEYKKAADEGLDSKWAGQTTNRARNLMEILRSLS